MAAKKKPAEVKPVALPSRRDDLIAMRQRLVAAMFEAEPNVLAQLVGQYTGLVLGCVGAGPTVCATSKLRTRRKPGVSKSPPTRPD